MTINFSSRNREISGLVRLDGNTNRCSVKGYANFFEDERVDISGDIDSKGISLDLKTRYGIINCVLAITDNGLIEAAFKTNHLKFNDIDLICDLESHHRIHAMKNPKMRPNTAADRFLIENLRIPNSINIMTKDPMTPLKAPMIAHVTLKLPTIAPT